MIQVEAAGCVFPVALAVLDKDGLMFESACFWRELAQTRLQVIRRLAPAVAGPWAQCMGVKTDGGSVVAVDPLAPLAVASPQEESTLTAGLLALVSAMNWDQCRRLARQIFTEADVGLDLASALRPRPGFPDILRQMRQVGLGYGVATSDTRQRVLSSLDLYDDPQGLAFILTPEDVSSGKPDPEMLLQVCRRFSVPPENLLMIGDSVVDVEMAKRAGAVGIGVPETPEMAERMEGVADVVVSSLEQIRLLPVAQRF